MHNKPIKTNHLICLTFVQCTLWYMWTTSLMSRQRKYLNRFSRAQENFSLVLIACGIHTFCYSFNAKGH